MVKLPSERLPGQGLDAEADPRYLQQFVAEEETVS